MIHNFKNNTFSEYQWIYFKAIGKNSVNTGFMKIKSFLKEIIQFKTELLHTSWKILDKLSHFTKCKSSYLQMIIMKLTLSGFMRNKYENICKYM